MRRLRLVSLAVWLCAEVQLHGQLSQTGQFQSRAGTSQFQGRLLDGTDGSYDGYVVEITNLPDHSIRDHVDVMPDGSFVFRSVVDGDYVVSVLTLYGVEVTTSYMSIGPATTGAPCEIRLPQQKLQKPVSGTVSMQQLNHPLSRQVQKLLDSSQKLIDSQRFADAAVRLREAVHDDPRAPQPHAQLGMVLSRLGSFDDAIAEYRSAISIDPKNSVLHSNLSTVLASMNRFDEAQVEASAALKLDPSNGRAHYILAAALVHVPGRIQDAVSHLVAAEDSFPSAKTALEKICAVQTVQGCP